MASSDLHKKQKAKNIALLVILLAIVALFFCITIVRFPHV